MFFVNMQLVQSRLTEESWFHIFSQEISAKALANVRCFNRSGEPGPSRKSHQLTIAPIAITRVVAHRTFRMRPHIWVN